MTKRLFIIPKLHITFSQVLIVLQKFHIPDGNLSVDSACIERLRLGDTRETHQVRVHCPGPCSSHLRDRRYVTSYWRVPCLPWLSRAESIHRKVYIEDKLRILSTVSSFTCYTLKMQKIGVVRNVQMRWSFHWWERFVGSAKKPVWFIQRIEYKVKKRHREGNQFASRAMYEWEKLWRRWEVRVHMETTRVREDMKRLQRAVRNE